MLSPRLHQLSGSRCQSTGNRLLRSLHNSLTSCDSPDGLPGIRQIDFVLMKLHRRSGATLNKLSDSEAAYLAGIIDGEGTITLTKTHRGENRRPVVSISSTELPLLLYVRSVIGAGRITNKRRAKRHHSPSFAYTLFSRQALTLLARLSRYLRTYKSERARLLLDEYVLVAPRNGRYTSQQRLARQNFEDRFFGLCVRAKLPGKASPRTAAHDVVLHSDSGDLFRNSHDNKNNRQGKGDPAQEGT